jgi:class 3 adenylate cyclase/tetratricopeptide (TPR) repeat protein
MNAEFARQKERKRVTVLFADISGSTELIEKMDPEDVIAEILPTVDIMSRAVQQFGGTVVKAMGDGIMAIFGAPVALEHHAERACRAALEIQGLVSSRRQEGGSPAPALRVHIGLASGEVVAGFLGEDGSAAYDAAGFTIHLASRLQAMAPAGATYISESTYRLVSGNFEFDHLGPTRVRGSAELVGVHVLKALQPDDLLRAGADDGHRRPPFVGRASELSVLVKAAERLASGQGGVVSVVGEAGIGKSRLLSEFKARIADMDLNWFEGAALSYGRTLAYWPFLEILHAIADFAEQDEEFDAWQKLEARLVELFGSETADILPYVATLLKLRVRGELEERVRFLDGEAIRRQVFRSMRLLFERMAQRRPTILLLEDAFWMDRSSAALLSHLIPLVDSVPLLFCLVTRGESSGADAQIRFKAAQDHRQRYDEVVLDPLSPGDADSLIEHLLATSNLPRRYHRAVREASEGNPLFVEELAQSLLVGDGTLGDTESVLSANPVSGRLHFELPGSIESVIMSRVDTLQESAKETLKTASVIGRTFFVKVLAAIVGSEQITQNGLLTLKLAGFILDHRQKPEPECMFKHALVQEATYNSVLHRQRRELHARTGAAIEHLFGDRLDDLFGLLAHHYACAENWEKAQYYLLKAGDQADRLAADEEALSHFQGASEMYMRAFGQEAEPIWKAAITRKIGEAHYRKGDNLEAMETFREALQLLGSRDPRTTSGLFFQILQESCVQLWHRLWPESRFDRRLGSATQAEEERVRIYIMLWWLHFFENPYRTLLYSLKTLNESELSGAVAGIVHSCSTLGFICCVLGAPRISMRYHARATRRARDSDNPVVFGHAALGLGWHSSYTGGWEDALEHFRQSAEASRGAGDIRQWGSATWGRVLVLCHMGRYAEAWGYARELSTISESSGDQVNYRWSHVAEGMLLLRVGDLEAAEPRLIAAKRNGQDFCDWQIYTKALCELARACLMTDRIEAAAAHIAEARATVRRYGLRGHHVTELRNLEAALHIATLRRAPSGSASPLQRVRAARACSRALRGGKVFRGSLPEALLLRGRLAWATGNAALADLWWKRCEAVCEELGAEHDLALVHIERGTCFGEPDLVRQGEILLAKVTQGVPHGG